MCIIQKCRKYYRLYLIIAVLTACSFIFIYQFFILDSLFSSPLTEDDLRSLNLTLGTLLSELDRLNVTYFMHHGTLIGSYRHHGRIPWDDDVDLMLNSSDKRRIYRALTALKPDYGLYLSDDFDSPYHWKFFPLRHGSSVPLRPVHWPFVDLLFFKENVTHVWNPSPSYSNECWPRSAIFPLQKRPFDNFWIPAPCDVLRVLIAEYDDVSMCVSRDFSHGYSIPMPTVAISCSSFANLYPMVIRRSTTVGSRQVVSESLVIDNRTLQIITLENACEQDSFE